MIRYFTFTSLILSLNVSASNQYECDSIAIDDMFGMLTHFNATYDSNYLALRLAIENKLINSQQLSNEELFHLKYVKNYIFFYNKNYDEFLDLSNQLIYNKQSPNCKHLTNIMNIYFHVLQGDNRYEKKIKVLRFLLKSKPNYSHTYLYNELANTYYHLECYETAIVNFKHLLQNVKDNLGHSSSIHNNIGLAYSKMNYNDQAKKHFKKALDLWTNPIVVDEIDSNVYKKFHLTIQDNIKSLELVKYDSDSLIYKKLKNKYIETIKDDRLNLDNKILLELLEYGFHMMDTNYVSKYLDEININLMNGHKILIEDKLRYEFILIQNSILNKKFDEAIHLTNQYRKAEVEINLELQKLKKQTKEIDHEWKTKLITELENVLRNEIRLKILLYILIFIFLLCFIFLYKSYLILKKRKHKIDLQKKEISISLANTNMLLKELHHRVKNNLQLVQSVAYIEYRKNGNDFDFESFKNRIASLSVIHKLLYSSENLSRVHLNTYIEGLMRHLKIISLDNFNYHLNILSINLQLDTSITLGLLINELVVNTIKHCLPNDNDKINIKITLIKKENMYIFNYSDNGSTFTPSSNNCLNIGSKLILLLIKKIRGEYHINTKDGYNLKINLKTLDYDKL